MNSNSVLLGYLVLSHSDDSDEKYYSYFRRYLILRTKLFPTQKPVENQSAQITNSQTPNFESVLAEMISSTNDLHWSVVLTSCTTWSKLSDLTISSDIK